MILLCAPLTSKAMGCNLEGQDSYQLRIMRGDLKRWSILHILEGVMITLLNRLAYVHKQYVLTKDDTVSKLKDERQKSVERMETFTKVITSVPGIDSHDANMIYHISGNKEMDGGL